MNKGVYINKNTPMLCSILEKLGYEQFVTYEGDMPFIYTCISDELPPYYSEANYGAPIINNYINCIDDEERFLTLAKQYLSE